METSLLTMSSPTRSRYCCNGLSVPIEYCSTAVKSDLDRSKSLADSGYPNWYFIRSNTMAWKTYTEARHTDVPRLEARVSLEGTTLQQRPYLQRIVNAISEGTMDTFPKFWLVASDVDVTHNSMRRTKNIIPVRP